MAKRTRYASRSSSRRPAANRLVRRDPPKAKPPVVEATPEPTVLGLETAPDVASGAPASARGAGLSQVEIERAAELEAEMTTRERALAAAVRQRAQGPVADAHAAADINAPLSVRASKEYAYVARDVRRIVLTGGLMVAILAVIAFLVNVVGVVQL
jgi:hypothetical protein